MTIANYKGFEIFVPTTGGKAGRGKAITGSMQVRKTNMILASFRFTLASVDSRLSAMRKVRSYIDALELAAK